MKDLKAGHIYHTIMFGLNAMGPHGTQINEEERWKIVHYVQTMQVSDQPESTPESTEETQVAEAENN